MKKQHIDLNNKTILITGGAGFIGSNLILRLLRDYQYIHIINIDCLTDYNPIKLKHWRLDSIEHAAGEREKKNSYTFIKGDIADKSVVKHTFSTFHPEIVVNLAAQAGVRYSIENPGVYMKSNIMGFYNILEACKDENGLKHLVYASSSSVYGGNKHIPFSANDNVDHPVSLYAATKKSNELLAHVYSKLHNIPSTGLRFFTVYGPAGRTDMAYFSFTEKLVRNESIDIFNFGNCRRDFTYIDDIIEGIVRVMTGAPYKATGVDGLPIPPYSIYNIGGGHPDNLMDFVHILAEELIRAEVLGSAFDIESHLNLVPMQPGDVPITYADTIELEKDYGFKPSVDLRTGLRTFAEWYRNYTKL